MVVSSTMRTRNERRPRHGRRKNHPDAINFMAKHGRA